jgi:hypothetical protein
MIVRRLDGGNATALTYLQLKTARAERHLDEIEHELSKVFKPEPYAITRQDYPKKFIHVIRVQSKGIPIEVPLLIGEFIYSLRSGLDQLAWGLARLHTSCPQRSTSFPIRDDSTRGLGDAVRDILPAAVAVIESLQPYHRGNAFKQHPLWILNRLSTIDKHRVFAVTSTEMRGKITHSDIEDFSDFQFRHLDYGAEIRVALSHRNKVQFQANPFELILGEPIPTCYGIFEARITTLRAIHDFVGDEVITRFAGFFK